MNRLTAILKQRRSRVVAVAVLAACLILLVTTVWNHVRAQQRLTRALDLVKSMREWVAEVGHKLPHKERQEHLDVLRSQLAELKSDLPTESIMRQVRELDAKSKSLPENEWREKINLMNQVDELLKLVPEEIATDYYEVNIYAHRLKDLDRFFALPREKQLEELDRKIKSQEKVRAEEKARAATKPPTPSKPNVEDPEQAARRYYAQWNLSTAEYRSKATEYVKMFEARRAELGLPSNEVRTAARYKVLR